jgi:hypothetical protein
MTTTTTKPDLLWNERGQIGCTIPTHAPYRGSDTWVWERWKKITRRQAEEFEREVGHPPACETCQAIERTARS